MTETLLIDCAFTKPRAAAIKAAGYSGVIGYISTDPSKDLTGPQARGYLNEGLVVAFVFETTAGRATAGKGAGASDRTYAEQQAHKRGYPTSCPIFYAVDGDYDPRAVLPYFTGVDGGQEYPAGVYGSHRVVETVLKAKLARFGWQTEAWSGSAVSTAAHLYQRTGKTARPIAGVKGSAYDEDVVLARVPLWGGALSPPAAPAKPRGFVPVTLAAIRFLTRRFNHRRDPLTPHADQLLAGLITAAQRVRALKK